jgi:hypothetical protein
MLRQAASGGQENNGRRLYTAMASTSRCPGCGLVAGSIVDQFYKILRRELPINLQKDALPAQPGQAGNFLTTDGTTAKWKPVSAANLGAVPVARTITAGSNLVGGGDLSDDRTIALVASPSLTGLTASGTVAAGTVAAGTFNGGGAGITGLDAGNVASGTLADGRLSGNVPLKNANNTFTADQTIDGGRLTIIGNSDVTGDIHFQNRNDKGGWSIIWEDLSQPVDAPGRLAAYFSPVGLLSTGNIVVSSNRDPGNWNLYGATLEPSNLTVVPDVPGPAISVAGDTTTTTAFPLAIYDVADIDPEQILPGGLSFGKKKWMIDAQGRQWWGTNLRVGYAYDSRPNALFSLGLDGTSFTLKDEQAGAGRIGVNSAGLVTIDRLNGVSVGINQPSPAAQLHVVAGSSTTIGAIIQGAASQTSDLFQCQDSSGNVVASVNYFGTARAKNFITPSGYVFASEGDAYLDSNASSVFLRVGGSPKLTIDSSSAIVAGNLLVRGDRGATIQVGGVNAPQACFQNAQAGEVCVAIKGAASQTANLQEWQDNSGTVLAKVNFFGTLTAKGVTTQAGYVFASEGDTYLDSAGGHTFFRCGGPTILSLDSTGATVTGNVFLASGTAIKWNSDAGLDRAAAGYVRATNGTSGLGALLCGQPAIGELGLIVTQISGGGSADLARLNRSNGTTIVAGGVDGNGDGYLNVGNAAGTAAKIQLSASTNNYLKLASDWQLTWDSASTGFGTKDTGLARSGAGALKVTDGGAGLGNLYCGELHADGVNGDISIDTTGNIAIGDSGPDSVTIQAVTLNLNGGGGGIYVTGDLSSTGAISTSSDVNAGGYVAGSSGRFSQVWTGNNGDASVGAAVDTIPIYDPSGTYLGRIQVYADP